jgi:Omp85 superfamily domain
MSVPMRFAFALCLASGSVLLAGAPDQEINVNSRYTVESVEFAGGTQDAISTGLRGELTRLVGERLNPVALDDLARRIRAELHVPAVTHRLMRGHNPQQVRVVFVIKGEPARFEASVPALFYQSQEGFTGAVEGTATVGGNVLTMGVLSDGDTLLERYSGVVARYEYRNLWSGRVRLRLKFESYHEQWNNATTEAVDRVGAPDNISGTYRSRENIEPVAVLELARPLTLSVGASFERLQSQFPTARTEDANAMVTTLRYHRRLEDSGANQQEWDAGYSLRAATNFLGSDFAYARHRWEIRYSYSWGRNEIADETTAGFLTGRAPLFERFDLGNSSMLEGWNRFYLDPTGGSRLVYNTFEYRYRLFDVFYDSGAIWDAGVAPVLRHSIGVGIRQNGFSAALAFPVRDGHIEPVFVVGMNY